MHQAILPGAHTPLTGVSTPHLHYSTSVVFPRLLPPSLLGGPLHLLISEPLEILHHPLLSLLLLRNPLPLGLFLGFGLRFPPSFLSRVLSLV